MSDNECPSVSGAVLTPTHSELPRPKASQPGKSTLSANSGYTVTNAQGVKLTRLARITDLDNLSPNVSVLPTDLTGDRAQFWHQWIGATFQDKVGSRGSGSNNARGWTFATFVTSYCDKFHPKLTPNERCQYEAILGQKVYYFLHNSTKRHSRPHANSDDEDKDISPSCIFAADMWAKDKPDEYREKLDRHFEENPDTKQNPGLRRSATFKVFATLSDIRQKQYQKIADDAMERIKKGQKLEGHEAEKFSKLHPQKLKKIISKAEKAVGAQALIFLMTNESLVKRNITVLSSGGFQEFSKSTSTAKLLELLKEHLQQTTVNSQKSSNGPPRPCVYPDRERNNRPSVPDLTVYTGGMSRFPWEEIAKDPAHWLGGKLPGDFKDPGSHDRNGNFVWLECLLAGQKDDISAADRIFIRRIHTANPIDPSESEEVSREQVIHQGREVWELVFNKPVTKCHAQKPLTWPEESLLYANYVRTGLIVGSYSNPYQLPLCPNTKTHLVLIDGDLYEGVITRANLLNKGKDKVSRLIDAYNEFASHLPAETTRGAWDGQPVPLVFSAKQPTQPPTANFFLREYLPPLYYQSPLQAQKEGTLSYFEMWIELILSGKLLSHGPSSTLLGGVTGCIWAVLGVVFILFNVAYVRGDAKSPFSPPDHYDLSRLSGSEWDRVRQWCRQLTKALNDSTRVLSPTSLYRLRGVVPTTHAPVEDPASKVGPVQTDSFDTNVNQKFSASPKPKTKSNRQKPTRSKAKGKGKERRRARATESESESEFSSDGDSDSTDYNRKDKSDEDSSEDEFSRLDVFAGTDGPGEGEVNAKSIRQLLPEDFDPHECPWGKFPDPEVHVDLPDYIASETLLSPMQSAYSELDSALQEWDQKTLMIDNLHTEHSYEVSEQNNPVLSDPRVGPMYATILTRELAWNACKAQGKALYPVLRRLKIASTTAFQYSLAWKELTKSAESLEGEEPNLDELNRIGMRLRPKIAQASWIYDEMLDYAHLSTAMAKKMDWLLDSQQRPAPNSPDVRKYAAWCMDWAKATEELEGEMMYHRRQCWPNTGRPFEKQFGKPSRYKFGNAIKEEWHQALEACLALSATPVSTSTPTTPATTPTPTPTTNIGTSNNPTTAPSVEEPSTNEMEQDPKENTMAKETGFDKSTEPITSLSGPDASGSTTGEATASAPNKRGRKHGPAKQAVVIEPRKTRADTKRKAEEAQKPVRKSQRRK
ncbi:AGAP001826-PA [Rhizoctonia solani]|uniref:AGAP001826-PA n=1 Tax=Rhizoctonia solani TaxID=456999 RepID=A0A0K6G8T5_9AGAM|nr:AGAP001826-PA [Rhizoctonia solani]